MPPSKTDADAVPAIFSIGPSLTMGMASAATAGFTVINNISNGGTWMNIAPTVIMASSMIAGSVMWPLISKGAEKQRKKKKEKNRVRVYTEYITELKENIALEVDNQRKYIIRKSPGPQDILYRIEYRERNLWERVSGQMDFLCFTAGIGSSKANIEIDFREKDYYIDKDPLYILAADLAKENIVMESVPITIDLTEDYIVGIIGSRQEVYSYIRGVIMQLTALQSYEELHIVVIVDQNEYPEWEFMRWLPHIYSKDGEIRFIACDTEDMKYISAELEKILAGGADAAYLIISCDKKLASKTSFVSKVLNSPEYRKFSLIAMYDELKYLPKECRKIIEVDKEEIRIHDSAGNIISASPEFVYTNEQCEQSAVSLANIRLAQSDKSYVLPNMITFMELMGVSQCEHLNCLQRWTENNPVNSLKAPIGVDENGDICYLDLHQDAHGPHGQKTIR